MTHMTNGLGRLAGLVAALSFALGSLGVPAPALAADPPLPAWDGSIDMYRDGVFTTQKSWLWCTAAGVQIVRNIVDDAEDHTVSGQRRYFNWMRERNKYTLPLSAGVDPQGWTAGLRHFVDDRYRLVTSTTFDNALRSAVKRLRLTNLPVALTVAHGNHGWILTGFEATEDPARTASFKVTSVRIVGPLFGLQSKNGYDMRPNTKLTPTQLKRYFSPWKYAPKAMIWDGRYVSIQPIPVETTTSAAAPSAQTGLVAEPSNVSEGGPAATVEVPREAEVPQPAAEGEAAEPVPTAPTGSPGTQWVLLGSLALAAIAMLGALIARASHRSHGRPGGGRLPAPG